MKKKTKKKNWVAVSERLPKEPGIYHVENEKSFYTARAYFDGKAFGPIEKGMGLMQRVRGGRPEQVTHWKEKE